MKVHNKEFYQALFDFSQKAADLLKVANREGLTRCKFKILDGEGKSWDHIPTFEYDRFVFRHSRKAKDLKEFDLCESIIKSDDVLSLHYNNFISVFGMGKMFFLL